MKSKSSILAALIILLFSCNNELQVRNYAVVSTNEVSDNSAGGALFSGSVSIDDMSTVTEHGFVWSKSETGVLKNSEYVKLGSLSSDTFSKKISYNLSAGTEYFVRSFITAKGVTIYGLPVKFRSFGSPAVAIVKFTPSQGQYLDTIKITAQNLSPNLERIKVSVTGATTTKVLSVKDDVVTFILPFVTIKNPFVTLQVGNDLSSNVQFNYLLPTIVSVTPETPMYCDSITVNGQYFPRDKTPVELIVNNQFVGFKRLSANAFKVPQPGRSASSIQLGAKIGDLFVEKPGAFTQLVSTIYSISEFENLTDTLVITGFNLPLCSLSMSMQSFGSSDRADIKIIKLTSTEIQGVIADRSQSAFCPKPTTLVVSPPVDGVKFIKWKPFLLPSGQNLAGHPGDVIEIKTSGMVPNPDLFINIGGLQALITNVLPDGTIYATVPPLSGPPGTKFDMFVISCFARQDLLQGFQLTP